MSTGRWRHEHCDIVSLRFLVPFAFFVFCFIYLSTTLFSIVINWKGLLINSGVSPTNSLNSLHSEESNSTNLLDCTPNITNYLEDLNVDDTLRVVCKGSFSQDQRIIIWSLELPASDAPRWWDYLALELRDLNVYPRPWGYRAYFLNSGHIGRSGRPAVLPASVRRATLVVARGRIRPRPGPRPVPVARPVLLEARRRDGPVASEPLRRRRVAGA